MSSTRNEKEIDKFSRLSDKWWDPNGPFKPLHQFNPCRINYILKMIQQYFCQDSKNKTEKYSELSLLDIGCGGGLIAEPMSRLGFRVSAIDASSENIKTAQHHAKEQSIDNIDYQHSTIEDLAKKTDLKYDIILALEIIEHVDNPDIFVQNILKLMHSNSILLISTINRNLQSLLCAKIMAEYVLNLLPRGTHQFKKFLKPSEIQEYIKDSEFEIKEASGFSYNLLTKQWKLSHKLNMNYMLLIQKK